ncbi:MAG: DsbE family thiol:disulfide interchange protein [Alphaproteobacteria bacterium]|nr:MAG: DsbE family thiol:disulfide interchange protein [Alphaproteobacteria bacterium]
MRTERLIWFLPLLAVLLLAGLLWRGLYSHDEVIPSARVGQPLPAVRLPRLDAPDRYLDQTALIARAPLLINFFASWCGPCQVEHPLLTDLAARGITIIGIAYKDEPADTRRFLDRLGNPFADVLMDRQGRALIEFGASGVPESFLVDRTGRIVWHQPGPLTEEVIARELLPRLATLDKRTREGGR